MARLRFGIFSYIINASLAIWNCSVCGELDTMSGTRNMAVVQMCARVVHVSYAWRTTASHMCHTRDARVVRVARMRSTGARSRARRDQTEGGRDLSGDGNRCLRVVVREHTEHARTRMGSRWGVQECGRGV